MKRTSIALLTAALALSSAAADVQLLPAGEFSGIDGRPGKGLTWKLSDFQGVALAAKLNARHQAIDFQFDYEHQLLRAASNGQPAPAAGWGQRFEWRTGQGLYALAAQWTPRAKEFIKSEEYKYVSPLIVYDEKTGEVTDVLNAALVGRPNLDLEPLALAQLSQLIADFSTRSTTDQQEIDMQLLAALCAALGLAATTTEADALNAVAALKVKADAKPSVPTALSAALGIKPEADEAAAVTAVAALKAASTGADDKTTQTIAALQAQVATLSQQSADREVTTLVTQALADGKLLPAQKDWATALGKQNLAQLSAFIKDAPVVAAGLGERQTQDAKAKPVLGADGKEVLSTEELAMCSAMGLTEDEFRAGKKLATA